jgi:hypothetical protein
LSTKGVIHQQSLRTKSKNVAIELESALKTSLVTGEHRTAKNCPTLKEFESRLFDHLRIHVKPRSLQFYREQYKVLTTSLLGTMRLSLIDSAACDAFKQWRVSQKVAIITVNHGIRTLRRALHQAEDWHLIVRAPKLKLLPGEHAREAVISENELTAMIEYAEVAYLGGPAAYDLCLVRDLEEWRKGPKRPDLSHLTDEKQKSIESACSDKFMQGPAPYDRCLVGELQDSLQPR